MGIYTEQVLDSYKGKNRLEVRRMAVTVRPELTGLGSSACLRHCRVCVLQHERIQREPVRHHLRRIWSRKDRSCKAVDAVYCERFGPGQFADSGNQGHGAGHESSARILRKRKDAEEQ